MSAETINRVLGLNVTEKVTLGNILTFLLLCMSTIMLAVFVPTVQPYVLTEVLNIPQSEQGVISGDLGFYGEIVIIITAGVWGVIADKYSRRLVTALGYLTGALGMVFYATADSYESLIIGRLIYAAGISALSTMVVTLVADYVLDESRGKATGYLGFMNGIGAMIAALGLAKLPAVFTAQGMTSVDTAYWTYMVMSIILVVLSSVSTLGLQKGHPNAKEDQQPFIAQLVSGFSAGKVHGIALAYGSSFLARGNLAVVGTFYGVWASNYGTQELGMTTANAVELGAQVITISYVASLLSAPLFGILSDKVTRVHALMIALSISFVGYSVTYFIEDPFGYAMMGALVLIGMAEVGCIITSGTLVAEQSPKKIRGSVIGFFTLMGAVGILVASKVGGELFDGWQYSGPFVFFGIIAFLVLVWAFIVRNKISTDHLASSESEV